MLANALDEAGQRHHLTMGWAVNRLGALAGFHHQIPAVMSLRGQAQSGRGTHLANGWHHVLAECALSHSGTDKYTTKLRRKALTRAYEKPIWHCSSPKGFSEPVPVWNFLRVHAGTLSQRLGLWPQLEKAALWWACEQISTPSPSRSKQASPSRKILCQHLVSARSAS